MPRTPSKPTSKRAGPYSSPLSTDDDNKPVLGAKTKGTTWTADELKALFHFAVNRNGRGWGEAVTGRTASQASQAWTKMIVPYLEKCLEDRAKG